MARGSLLILLATSTLAMTSPALAQHVAMPPAPKLDTRGFSGDPNALPNAVAAIESGGGRVVEIRYDNQGGAPEFNVVVARGGGVSFERIARPASGAVMLVAHSEPDWMLKWRARKDLHVAHKAKVSLDQAIRTAEASRNGAPAVAAGIAVSASNPASEVHAYNVVLLDRGAEHRVAVDTRTGAVITDPQALSPYP